MEVLAEEVSRKRKADELTTITTTTTTNPSLKATELQSSINLEVHSPEEVKYNGVATQTLEDSTLIQEATELVEPTVAEASLITNTSVLVEVTELADGVVTEVPPNESTTKEAPDETLQPEPTRTTVEPPGFSKAVKKQSDNPYDSIRWITVRNDGQAESMIKLIGLKSLFAKQLPKMPRAYIARLVLDRRHTSLAILSDNPALENSDEQIIGGICYRAFQKSVLPKLLFVPSMRRIKVCLHRLLIFLIFEEAHVHLYYSLFSHIKCPLQPSLHNYVLVKGYGTKLMNLLKQIAARTGIEFFITYADNYAIGYFKKQGFTKTITMPKGRYQGLIKDYDGGTPMECYIHPSIDFFRVPALIQAQRSFLLQRIARRAKSHRTIYPPLLDYTPEGALQSASGMSRTNWTAAKAMSVPGVVQAGWTLQDFVMASQNGNSGATESRQSLKQELLSMLRKVEEQQFAWPFREPVDTNEVPDYMDVIKEPIDLKKIEKRIRQDNHYKSKAMLLADLMLMVENCKTYNEDGSTYTHCAIQVEKFVKNLFMLDNNGNMTGGATA